MAIKWDSVLMCLATTKNFIFLDMGDQKIELAITWFWSGGIGNYETAIVGFET